MKKILTIGGSNSPTSINKAFATFTVGQLNDIEANIIDLNDFEMPIYHAGREEESGQPDLAQKFLDEISGADGIIISLAEHNASYSVAFKNVLDWASRVNGKVWQEKPMLLMATSPGGRGGLSVLEAAAGRFPRMGGNIVAQFSLPSFYDNLSENGIVDEELKKQFEEQLEKFNKAI
ncbi:MAG: NAD(P)H-dependent oxidoreductase [Flavobacteriales bacterium]|nr:NAD(P)H-dependent oxidoreductase [Flavobacteriales bacterium]